MGTIKFTKNLLAASAAVLFITACAKQLTALQNDAFAQDQRDEIRVAYQIDPEGENPAVEKMILLDEKIGNVNDMPENYLYRLLPDEFIEAYDDRKEEVSRKIDSFLSEAQFQEITLEEAEKKENNLILGVYNDSQNQAVTFYDTGLVKTWPISGEEGIHYYRADPSSVQSFVQEVKDLLNENEASLEEEMDVWAEEHSENE